MSLINGHRDDISTPVPETQKQATVCVFCGSSPGNTPSHLEAARELARAMHAANIKLVYGGGTTGIMGELAKTLVSLSGPEAVHGIIPKPLLRTERKFLENGTTDENDAKKLIDQETYGRTTVVEDMHTRKQMMAREVIESGHGSGFVALTGGYGTFEELLEMVTWNQLGIHARAIVVYNVEGYWDGLFALVRNAVDGGFVTTKNKDIMVEAKTGQEVVDRLRTYENSADRLKLKWGEK